ncbi:HU family DNA-binding protein [Tenacibaculum sp.]|uniref:HU family DNA-binding protein n=1 Tax=Tenacibaculum sp. TaxID=1906242 RepID=UPI003D0D1D1D
MKNLEKIYKKVSRETGLTKYEVEDIFKSQFELVELAMREKEDIPVRVYKLFTFRVKAGRRERLNKKIKDTNKWKTTTELKDRKVNLLEILKLR